MQNHFRTFALLALAGAAMMASSCANAFVYTVGRSGIANNCSFATVQAALNAAAASAADDEIWITRDVAGGYYQNQALQAWNVRGTLKIVGGFDDCRDVTPDGVTELHGNGGAHAPVLDIGRANVTLSRLRITRGERGGINFTGDTYASGFDTTLRIEESIVDRNENDSTEVRNSGGGITVNHGGAFVKFTLDRTEVSDNRSTGGGNGGRGGGIRFVSMSPPPVRRFEAEFIHDVRINGNYARDGGGGMSIPHGLDLDIRGFGFLMQGNGTLGDGGAILAEVDSDVLTIMPGRRVAGSLGTFVGNEARNGGAIALRPAANPVGGDTSVLLGSGNLDDPQVFFGNRAHERGGAVYIDRPTFSGVPLGDTEVCASNVSFEENDAAHGGSAVMATGRSATFLSSSNCGVEQPRCTHISCNHYAGHKARLDDGQPSTDGSLFMAQTSARIVLDRPRIANNSVPLLFRVLRGISADPSTIAVDTALIYKNDGRAIASNVGCDPADSCQFRLDASTVVANTLSERVFFNSVSKFILLESIIDQPGLPLFISPEPEQSGLAHVLYTSSHQSNVPTVRYGEPGFMNAAAMDYRLSGNSQAIDNLPADGTSNIDFIGRDRNVDIPGRPNGLGPRDLGAVETQLWEVGVPDVIFRNGFD